MLIKRLTPLAAFVSALLLSSAIQAKSPLGADAPLIANPAPQRLSQLPIFSSSPMLAQSTTPSYADALSIQGEQASAGLDGDAAAGEAADQTTEQAPAAAGTENITDLRKALIAMAMKLRDIRYVRGGHNPATGFDCSGFVRYVFAHAIGMQLPTNSASQFLAGLKVKRADMKPGDLVFFHTHGRRRISHVGIYIADGQFIHSPTTGKSVQISSLDEAYWAKHFVGAKRPEAMALVANNG